jgi:hypothetical protein
MFNFAKTDAFTDPEDPEIVRKAKKQVVDYAYSFSEVSNWN